MKKLAILLLLAMLLMASCGKDVPDDTIPPESPSESIIDTQESETEAITETEPVTETEKVTETETETEKATEVKLESGFLFEQLGDRIQIGIYVEPNKAHTDAAHYNQIKKAGITVLEMRNAEIYRDPNMIEKVLDLCDEREISVIVHSDRIQATVPALAKKGVEGLVSEYKHHPSFVGLFIKDEPRITEDFAPAYEATAQAGYHAHLNLFPHFVDKVENYQGYVEDAVISLGVENMDYLQFDQYPFRSSSDANIFLNLNLIRLAGQKYGLNTACYIQSMGIKDDYRDPTGAETRWHTSAALAYGFKYLTYYTWAMPAYEKGFTSAIIDKNGKATDLYDAVVDINAKIHGVGELLANLDAMKVTLTTGKENGIETATPATAALHPKGKNVFIVSYMERRGDTQEYVMLVNNNYKNDVTETFTVSKNVTALIDCTNGKETPVDISSGEITLTIAAGDFMLFKLGEGDDFVQVKLDADEMNLAQDKPVAVEKTYTNAFADSGSYAFCLTDGIKGSTRKTAKGWHCQTGKADIDIDLKRAVPINRVDVYPYGYSRLADFGKLFPRDFDVQVSVDGETWTTVASVTGFDETKDGIPSLKFDPVEARYVRIHVTKGVSNAFEIAEIEVYNDDGSVPAVKDMHK